MLLDYLLFFAVCQATYVQPDGITLPITSLSYKSLPTNPKDTSLTLPSTENIETSSDAKLIESVSPRIISSKYVYPGSNQRLTGPISMFPQPQLPQLQTNSPRQAEKPISIQNLSLNTVATPQVTKLPLINLRNKLENNTLWDKISNNYAPKISSLVAAQSVISNKNDNTVNLKYSAPILGNWIPYNTYKINNVDTPAIYIDGNKQKCFKPEVLSSDRKDEGTHLISERNQVKNVRSKTSEGMFVPNMSVNSSQQQNINFPKVVMEPLREKQKIPSNEIPTAMNTGIHSNNIGSSFLTSPYINSLNAPPVSGKISITPHLASTDNKVDLTVTPSVKIGNNDILSSPHQITVSDVKNINNIGLIYPNTEPSNHVQAPVPTLTTYFYVPKELPKVYQLPNVYTNTKIAPLHSTLNDSPTSSICMESDINNYVRRDDSVTVPLQISNYAPTNIMPKTQAFPSVSKHYAAPTQITNIPIQAQLPNISPTVTYPTVSQLTDIYPSNVIYINMADMSSPKCIDNRVPTTPVTATTNSPLYKTLDSRNIKSVNYIPVPNVIHYPPEQINPAITSSLESQYLCPPNSVFPLSSDLGGSSISESLNNIISSLTTGLLSAFYGITTPEENVLSIIPDSEITTNFLNNIPSSIYSETTISLSMPVFMLSPPQLESPTFLPAPKIELPLKHSEDKLLSKKKPSSGLKKPKPYISTITINLLPKKEETNDIIIML